MKLYLVRHGASSGNTPGTLIGHSPHPLTEAGLRQARAVAAVLAPLGPMPVYCSDLPRARQTAELIAAAWCERAATRGRGLSGNEASSGEGEAEAPAVRPDRRLREIDLGAYEGRSWGDYLADAELHAAMAADPLHTALPSGESLAQLRDRVLTAVDDIVGRHAGAAAHRAPPLPGPFAAPVQAGAACLVAHDGPLRVILNHFLGVQPEKWWTLTTSHGGLSLVEWSDGWVNVRFVNSTAHLEGAGMPAAARPGSVP